jgi:polyphosphate kinase
VAERVRLRRYEPVVRIEFGPDADPTVRDIVLALVDLTEAEAYELPAAFDLTILWTLASLDIPAWRDQPWTPRVPAALRNQEASIFPVIRAGDLLVRHPYESFDASVERFVREGAADPGSLGVKMTVTRRLLVAPWNMRDRFLALIEREVEHHRAGRPARLVAKMNQLEEARICEAPPGAGSKSHGRETPGTATTTSARRTGWSETCRGASRWSRRCWNPPCDSASGRSETSACATAGRPG